MFSSPVRRDDYVPGQPRGEAATRSANGRTPRTSSRINNSGDNTLPLLDLMSADPRIECESLPPNGNDQTSRNSRPVRSRFVMIGRLGGLTKSARHDPRDATTAARAGLWAKFLSEADPDGSLSDEERARRADVLMRLHMTRLSLRSANVRRGRPPR